MPVPKISLTSPFRYALEGRVVTLGPQGTLNDGAIYIDDGAIHAVQPAALPAPSGFENATRVRTGSTLFPGLIELHNHLAYNAVPLWHVTRPYENNGQWRSTHEYRRNVTGPAKVLGNTEGLVEAVIRFVECRSLLGGTTTSQGITLIGVGTKDFFPGLVRNVEAPAIQGLPAVKTRIGNPPSDEDEKLSYLDRQRDAACYLQHLSEGVNGTARNWFLRLHRATDGEWMIHNSFCGIHSTALLRQDFDVIVEHGGSMVWSPLSNYLLYGDTADVNAIHGSGIKVGLGSDWAPSGSKSLLGELKVAWLANLQAGSPYSAKDLVEMATINAAEILGWASKLGSLEANKRADIIAINGKTGDEFMQLIKARDTSITMVVIDGVPRVGQSQLMGRFELDSPEDLMVGSSRRVLHLAQASVHPLLQGLTLADATQALRDALDRLPELATEIGNAFLAGETGADPGSRLSEFRLDLELDDEPFDLLAGSLADDLFPMTLEGITVADDPTFLPKMVAASNLPPFVKEGLPGLYGESVPEPFEGDTRRMTVPGVPRAANATPLTLRHFLASWRRFSRQERKIVVEQALLILEEHYVHLPFKRSMHGVDPVQRLRLLQYQLDQSTEQSLPSDIEFHNEITQIFHSLRDLHTTYRLPYPFRRVVAWLPFFVEEYWDADEERYRYVISKVIGDDVYLNGVELLYWNGTPIAQAVAANAERQAGSNPHARRARGLNSMTIRPLGRGLPPNEDWVTLRYRDEHGVVQESRHDWLVFIPESATTEPDPVDADLQIASSLGLDDHTDDVQEAKKALFAPEVWTRKRKSAPGERFTNGKQTLETSMPTVFRAREVKTESGRLGHIRIFTFNVSDADEFINELGRLAANLPARGLILDVRGNGGGLIPAAEGALRLFTSQRVEPQRAQFINTPLNLALCQNHPDDRVGGAQLGRWTQSVGDAIRTGAIYSLGFPITSPAYLDSISQRYFGPVCVLTDALCYSATDMFVAGFQDHGIGPIVGVHENTGAGGANVWPHGLLRRLWTSRGSSESPYVRLPEGADFRVAMRRTIRVGLNSGGVVEDIGIRPNKVLHLTKSDLLGNNEKLLDATALVLAHWQNRNYQMRATRDDNGFPRVTVSAPDGRPTEFTLSIHLHKTIDESDGQAVIDLADLLTDLNDASAEVEVHGASNRGEPISHHANLGQLLSDGGQDISPREGDRLT